MTVKRKALKPTLEGDLRAHNITFQCKSVLNIEKEHYATPLSPLRSFLEEFQCKDRLHSILSGSKAVRATGNIYPLSQSTLYHTLTSLHMSIMSRLLVHSRELLFHLEMGVMMLLVNLRGMSLRGVPFITCHSRYSS